MSVSYIDVELFKTMIINGAINLKNHRQQVDMFNVFPVPDGDTGTNMSMTVTSGVRELENCESSSIVDNAKVLSRGCLMGARGNSGVILSQFFRGLFVGIKGLELPENKLSLDDLIKCFQSGREIAYKAVMKPVEGTILTVIREAIENTQNKKYDDILSFMEDYTKEANRSLENTPNLLPVLKEAGVLDSGGAGFVKIVEGMTLALKGEILDLQEENAEAEEKKDEHVDIETGYMYQMEFTLLLNKPDAFEAKVLGAALALLGDKLSLKREGNEVIVSVITDRPGRALEISQKQGEFAEIAIKNLKYKKPEGKPEAPKKNFALVSVCFGEGIVNTFKEMGVDYVIEGGQTMNPSTESFVKAIEACNAKNVIIIPNNGNVIMAANQAASLVTGTKVAVLKAKTIAQGYAALVGYNSEATMEENVATMEAEIESVTSGEVTYSIRDTEIGGVKITAGDYMGITDGEIVVSTKEKSDALKSLLEKIVTEDSEVVTIFYGKDITEDEANALEEVALSINENLDVEIIPGLQEIYSYIIAVE